jgi:hypothetical protein
VPGVTAIDLRTGAVPVPVRVTICGLESPESTTVKVALRLPCAVGVNVTEIVQLDDRGSVAGLTGQVFVSL